MCPNTCERGCTCKWKIGDVPFARRSRAVSLEWRRREGEEKKQRKINIRGEDSELIGQRTCQAIGNQSRFVPRLRLRRRNRVQIQTRSFVTRDCRRVFSKRKKKKKKKKKNVPVHLYENYRKNRAVESLVKRKSSLFDRPFVLSELEKRNSRSSLGTEVEKELCTGFLGYLWTDSLPLGHGELFPEFVEKRRGDYRVKRCVLSRSVGFARPLAWKIQKSVLCEQRFRRPHFRTSFSYFPNRIPYGTELLEFYKKERSHSFRF